MTVGSASISLMILLRLRVLLPHDERRGSGSIEKDRGVEFVAATKKKCGRQCDGQIKVMVSLMEGPSTYELSNNQATYTI